MERDIAAHRAVPGLTISDAIAEAMMAAVGLMTGIDDRGDASADPHQRAVARLAAMLDAALYLADRSLESWA